MVLATMAAHRKKPSAKQGNLKASSVPRAHMFPPIILWSPPSGEFTEHMQRWCLDFLRKIKLKLSHDFLGFEKYHALSGIYVNVGV